MPSKISIILLSIIFLTFGMGSLVQAEVITIGGTGSSGPLIQKLFNEYHKHNTDVSLRVVSPALGSNGALKALKAGRIDIAIAGRPLSTEEGKYGKNFKLASTPFVMCTRDMQMKCNLTLDELANIYNGSQPNWPSGAPIRLIIRGNFESDTLLLKSMSPAMNAAIKSSFLRPGMAVPKNDLETVLLLGKTANILGPTTMGLLSTLDQKLVVFSINGIKPSTKSLQDGSYLWSKELTVILPHKLTPAIENFALFLTSPEAQTIMLKYHYLPSGQ
ncbi:PstS family phosphate ABC transporter substrate-binding protein [Maridesulfovibrio frigidus]|uniref:PstS family phosphate ABC transporter substrate-binding protein n=1 Tax=Maridesulfovibrio frigidus TaxID=340956 RepID=UPI0004E12F73|nr:substrate-binding domain-containing protein [Maridesulfovibrio frigidus]